MPGWLAPARVPILYYHEIGADAGKHVVTPAAFVEQLDWLLDAGFSPLSIDAVLEVYAGRRAAPPRPVVLSFDDGRAGVRDHAAPALAQRRLPAVLYLVTAWLDGAPAPESERYSGFVGWSDLPGLEAAGFSLGSHTVTHRNLKRIPLPEAEQEIVQSKRRLEDGLGRCVDHFSYPYGRRTRALERAVRRAGYRSAVVTGDRVNGRLPRRHRLRRLRVDGREPLAALRRKLGDS